MNNTKQLLIDITFDMLYKRGYCATGLTDILQSANLTKGAMYYHFKNKNDLVLSTMQFYLEFMLESHWTKPLAEGEHPINTLTEQIDALYNLYADENAFLMIKHGCPLNNFIQDMSAKENEFFEYLQDIYGRWQENVEKALLKAQKSNQTKTEFQAKDTALFIVSAIEGSICSAKANNDLATLRTSFNVLNHFIKSL